MKKAVIRMQVSFVAVIGIAVLFVACKKAAEPGAVITGNGRDLAAAEVTITYDPASNTCTQNPRIVSQSSAGVNLAPGDTITYKVVGANSVTVSLPQPIPSPGPVLLPGTPFFDLATSTWVYSVSSGAPSKPLALTPRETPGSGDSFTFYYSAILVNGGTACNIDLHGMGVQITR